jgi:phospholipid/cholesterol/gamma-HCH transport system permease protein
VALAATIGAGAVRASVTATVFVLLTITLAVYGQSGTFHLSG